MGEGALLSMHYCPGLHPTPTNKKALFQSEGLGLFLISGVPSGSPYGSLCVITILSLAMGLSAEGLVSY